MLLLMGILLTYVAAPMVVWTLLAPLNTKNGSGWNLALCLMASLVLAPQMIAIQLLAITAIVPDAGPLKPLWLTLTAMPWIIILFFIKRSRQPIQDAMELSKYSGTLSWILVTAIGMLVIASLWMPLRSNDPVQYARLAWLSMEEGGFSFYPMDAADTRRGFLVYMMHPLGYPAAILWHYLIQGDSTEFGSAKLITLWNASLAVILVAAGCGYRSLSAGAIAGLSLLLTPLFAYQTISHGIDPLYLSVSTLLIILLGRLHRPTIMHVAVLSVVAGMAAQQHSVGAVVVALTTAAYVLAGPGEWRQRLGVSVLVAVGAVVLGGWQYMENWLYKGRPLGDEVLVWNLPELQREAFLRAQLGIDSVVGRLWNGVLMAWSKPWYYGVLPWLFVASLPFTLGLWHRDAVMRIAVLFVVAYLIFSLALVLMGVDTSIRGNRYFLAILPAMSIVVGRVADMLIERSRAYSPNNSSRGVHPALLLALYLPVAIVSAMHIIEPIGQFIANDQAWFERAAKRKDSIERLVAETGRIAEDGLVLTYRMDRLDRYTQVRYVRGLDERLVPFYTALSKKQAYAVLCDLGISHILVPEYPLAMVENSWLPKIIEDEKLAQEIFSNASGALYELHTLSCGVTGGETDNPDQGEAGSGRRLVHR